MATYLTRPCPRCNGYLGIVLREPGRNTPVRAVNGHCLKCGYRMAWIVIKGKQAARHQRRKKLYAEPTKNT
jgi:C4-type Zn-finger protein